MSAVGRKAIGRYVRRVVLGGLIGLVGGVSLLLGLGYLYQDELEVLAVKQLSHYLYADIHMAEVDVSFFHSWPDVAVILRDVTASLPQQELAETGQGRFPQHKILEGADLAFSLDLYSFLTNEYQVNEIQLARGQVMLLADQNGRWNWELMLRPVLAQDSTSAPDTSRVRFRIEALALKACGLRLQRPGQQLDCYARPIDLQLRGAFASDQFTLATRLDAKVRKWVNQGQLLIQNQRVRLETAAKANTDAQRYTIKRGRIQLAELAAELSGQLYGGQNPRCDLTLQAAEGEFQQLLSLLPRATYRQLKKYDIGGHFRMSGGLAGPLTAAASPTLKLDFRLNKGQLKHPEPRLAFQRLTGRGRLQWDFDELQRSFVRIDQLKGRLAAESFELSGRYSNFQQPRLALAYEGGMRLEQLAGLMPKQARLQSLQGYIKGHFRCKGRLADFRNQRLQKTEAEGTFQMENVRYDSPQLGKALRISQGHLHFGPETLALKGLTGNLGGVDFALDANFRQYLAYLLGDQAPLRADVRLRGGAVHLGQWLQATAGEPADDAPKDTASAAFGWPERIHAKLDLDLAGFAYGNFSASQLAGRLRYEPGRLQIDQATLATLDGRLTTSGEVTPERWAGQASIEGIDIHQFFHTFPTYGEILQIGERVAGRLFADMTFAGQPQEALVLAPHSIQSQGSVRVEEGRLWDFQPLMEIAGFIKLTQFQDIDFQKLQLDYALKDSRFHVRDLAVEANNYQLHAQGWQSLDERMDYHIRVTMPQRRWQGAENEQVQQWVHTEASDRMPINLLFHLQGDFHDPQIQLDRQKMRQEVRKDLAREGEEIGEAAKTERQRIFGRQQEDKADDWVREQE